MTHKFGILNPVTLPTSGRPQQIALVEADSAGTSSVIVIPEDDAISLTIYVTSLTEPGFLDIRVEELGADENNKRLIKRIPQLREPREDPQTFVLPVGGRVKITADYGNAVSFEIHGKAVGAAAITEITIPPPSEGEGEHWENNRQLLIEINENLKTMVNHLRLITGMEQESIDGGEF